MKDKLTKTNCGDFEGNSLPPKYIRMPGSRGRCPYSGLSRSTLYRLSVACHENNWRPPVRSIKLKTRNLGKMGCRLIDAVSLFDFLDEHGSENEDN